MLPAWHLLLPYDVSRLSMVLRHRRLTQSRNTTLPCDNILLRMAGSVDNYYWDIDNVTELCSSDCYAAVQFWDEDVSNRCVYDNLVAYSKVVPAASVSGRYNDGMNIACLTNQK